MKRLLLALILAAPLVLAACVDSDGGREYSVYGVCEDAFKERSDSCTLTQGGDAAVIEYYCNFLDRGECRPVTMPCVDVNGSTGECVDGACVAAEEAVVEPEATVEVTPAPSESTGNESEAAYEPAYYFEEGKPKAAEDWTGWLLLFLIAVGFVTVYNYSAERKGKTVGTKKKKVKRSRK